MTSVDDRWTPPLPPPPQARRGPRILLGVTGSVAAIKAPALVCRLLRLTADGDTAHVKILLTAGGRNFWNRAAEYDPISWMQLQEHLPQPTNIKSDHADDLTSSQEPTPAQSIVVPPRIELHCR